MSLIAWAILTFVGWASEGTPHHFSSALQMTSQLTKIGYNILNHYNRTKDMCGQIKYLWILTSFVVKQKIAVFVVDIYEFFFVDLRKENNFTLSFYIYLQTFVIQICSTRNLMNKKTMLLGITKSYDRMYGLEGAMIGCM